MSAFKDSNSGLHLDIIQLTIHEGQSIVDFVMEN